MDRRIKFAWVRMAAALWLTLLLISACANAPQPMVSDEFLIVPLPEGMDPANLARAYLSDSSKDWRLVKVDTAPGPRSTKEVLVPLVPLVPGGLYADGYQTVPIMRYQRFAEAAADKNTVSKASFEAQMKYLKQAGYRVISLAEMLRFMEFKEDIPPKAVVITIDDGWHSTLDVAIPILKEYGFPATLFVQTQFIGHRQALSWQELQLMSAEGVDIQCGAPAVHKSADLRDKDAFVSYVKNQDRQLSSVQKAFRKYLQKQCACVAYPDGETNNLTVALVRKEGFRAGFVLNDEPNPFFADPYFIGRTRVTGDEDLDRFEQKLTVFSKWPQD
jgi:peptidoglycan/xylan/chitin deacetylase (PgdA/CDA1 family)